MMDAKKYPIIECADGFRMSVQANELSYASPRDNIGPFTHVEVGYPSSFDFYLREFAEDPERPTETVYGWVPAHIVRMCIDAHGGIVAGELPPMCPEAWEGEG